MGEGPLEVEGSIRKILKQLILEYRNPQGALALLRSSRLTPSDIRRLLQEFLGEAEEKNLLNRRQFDLKTMRYLALEEWIEEYFEK